MFKKLFSHTAIYGLAPQITKVASIFTLPIITRYLTELDFGVYGYVISLIGAISIFSNLGLNIVLSNSFYKYPERFKVIWRQIYGILIVWSIPYTIILSVIIYLFIPIEAHKNWLWIVLLNVIPIVLFGPTAILGSLYYQLKQKPVQIASRTIATSLVTIVLNLFFIVYLKLGYLGWFLSTGIVQVFLQASYWYPLNKKLGISPIFSFRKRFLKHNLLVSFPTIPHYYGGYILNSSDKLVMHQLQIPITSIGLYNGASTVANFFMYFGNAAGQAGSPMMLQAYKNNDEKLARKIVFSLQTVFFVLGFLASIWLKEVFSFLIKNEEIQRTYDMGIILVMAYCYRPMYLGAINKIFYTEQTKVLFKVTLIAGLGTLALNFILIPIFSYKMAAFTLFIGLMYMGYSGYFLKQFRSTTSIRYYPILWLFVHILLTAISYYAVELPAKHKLSISAVLIVLLIIGIFIRKNKILKNGAIGNY